MMRAWQATVQDEAGNAVFNPQVTVYQEDGSALADIFNEDGTDKPNPFTGTTEGFVQFWAKPGTYKIRGANGGVTELWDVSLVSLAPPYTPFSSREDAESSVIPDDVQYINVSGLQFVRDPGGTALTTGGGDTWSPVGNITANAWGFHPDGSAESNGDSILAAVMWAGGQRVYVDTHGRNFLSTRLNLEETSADIELRGGGRWEIHSGGAISFLGGTSLIQVVTAIDRVTINIQGSPVSVTRLSVSDSDGYAKGDVVKICSDELDPWDDRGGRKLGEWSTVIDTEPGFIFLAGVLEDSYSVSQNCRVGRLSKNEFRFVGDIQSNLDNTSVVMQLNGVHRPYVRMDVSTHGAIVTNAIGCYMGDFYLSGTGKGDSEGSLGYLINDASGHRNTIHRPRGSYFRHVTTTNAMAHEDNSDRVYAYGPTREHTVIGGVAVAPQGPAWDDHSGARRTQWIDCRSEDTLRSSAAADCSYQIRGRDTTIIRPSMSSLSQTIGNAEAMIRVTNAASGSVMIVDPRLSGQENTQTFISMPSDPNYGRVDVIVQGGVIQANNCNTVLPVSKVNLTLVGTLISHIGVTRSNTRTFDVTDAELVLHGVSIVFSGTGVSAQIARLNEGGVVAGYVMLRQGGVSFSNSIVSTDATAIAEASVTVMDSGSTGFAGSGEFSYWSVDVKLLQSPEFRRGSVRAPVFSAAGYPFRVLDMPESSSGIPVGSLYRDGADIKIRI